MECLNWVPTFSLRFEEWLFDVDGGGRAFLFRGVVVLELDWDLEKHGVFLVLT